MAPATAGTGADGGDGHRRDASALDALLTNGDEEASFGAFSASVAHGINTQLMEALAGVGIIRHVVRTMLNVLDDATPVDVDAMRVTLETVLDAAGSVRDGIDGAASVTRGVGVFGVYGAASREAVDLAHVLDAVRAVTVTVAKQRAGFVVEVGPLPHVVGDTARAGRTILSAVLEVVRGIPDGDPESHTITLRASSREVEVEVEVEHRAAAPDGSSRVLKRSTLSFRVAGALEARRASNREPPPGAVHARRRGRVLVLDDEPVLLDLMARILRIDHEVTSTTKPSEALARIEAGEEFDAFLCDMMMPAMSGEKVYRRVLEVAPALAQRMIFLTAGAFSPAARDFLQGAPVVWYEKPIDPELLREIISSRVRSR